MDHRGWEILDELAETEFKTSAGLGETLGVSEKTIRNRIKEINGEIAAYGAEIVSKPRYGYYLRISSRREWESFRESSRLRNSDVPADTKERSEYLLAVFLTRPDYIKLEELSNFLYVSQKTLSIELKKTEYILNQFDIRLDRRPYYGVRADGSEFRKRNCILQNFILRESPFFPIRDKYEHLTETIAEHLLALMNEYQIRFAETAFQNTVLYVFLSIYRMEKGFFIDAAPDGIDRERAEFTVSERLYGALKSAIHTQVKDSEIVYTGIYIAGKRLMENDPAAESNIIISEETDRLTSEILERIYHTYNVELRDNLNLRIMLGQHLIPLRIRMKYKIPIDDHLLGEVKGKYFFAFSMAQQAGAVIAEHLGAEISENETAYLALYFALALEEKKDGTKNRKNILLVCVSGKASSQMLMYRFRQEFGEYIKTLNVCSMYDFDHYDLSKIDFIFSTVPIYKKVPVPVMEIRDFMESGEIMAVRQFLRLGDFQFIDHFYSSRNFFSHVKGETREDVIREMCGRIRRHTELAEDFEDSVLERESFGPTDYGNLTAIPHPCRIMTDEPVVAVAVLDEPILWSSHMVQVVILVSLASERTDETQKFYDVTTKFLMNKNAVLRLIGSPDFQTFREILCETGMPHPAADPARVPK